LENDSYESLYNAIQNFVVNLRESFIIKGPTETKTIIFYLRLKNYSVEISELLYSEKDHMHKSHQPIGNFMHMCGG